VVKPNYAFAKRQRDLAKMQKKEAKRQKKAEAAAQATIEAQVESSATTKKTVSSENGALTNDGREPSRRPQSGFESS
jgi:hypothetical protein